MGSHASTTRIGKTVKVLRLDGAQVEATVWSAAPKACWWTVREGEFILVRKQSYFYKEVSQSS